jgi:glycosyltransferase involved in cell wall biosynthesis
MRILLCKGQIYGPISGSDETLVTYATQLRRAGHDVSVLLMYLHAEEDQYYQRLLEADVPVSWIASDVAHTSMGAGRKIAYKVFNALPSSKKFIRRRSLKLVTLLAKRHYQQCLDHIKRQNVDLIHVLTPDPNAMVMIQAGHDAGVPVVYQELGIPFHPPDFESYYAQFASVLPLCSKIAALSPRLFDHCSKVLSNSNALCVLPIMSDEPRNGHEPRHAQKDIVTFGFAARMEHLKGTMVLMDAFADVYHQSSAVRLNIAGDGSQRRKLAVRAKALNVASRYRYHGVYTHPEDCRAFMESLDVFVMPSLSEGTPNSIVEAMACGKPIIASEVGGIPDMIGDDAGFCVPAGDAKALADAMLRLARDSDLRNQMGCAARERYERLFSPRVVLPLMMSVYEEAARNGERRPLLCDTNHPWSRIK